MFDTIFHRWLRIPYLLHVTYHGRRRRPRATILFLHGIGNSSAAWRDVIKELPDDVQVITIDLLGFGKSPKPAWATYNAKAQALAVLRTYFKRGLPTRSRIIVVGHSLGALVAVEMAKRYPLLIRSLVLCSPPFYDLSDTSRGALLPRSDKILVNLYVTATKHPTQFLSLSDFLVKYKLLNPTFNVTSENVGSYMAALESMIINQTSLDDAASLTVPTHIMYGTLDPVIVSKNLRKLSRENDNIALDRIVAGHEVTGRYIPAVLKLINDILPSTDTHRK